jgi:hypothetical protein
MVCLSEFCECAKQKYKRIPGPRCVARKMIFLLFIVCLWKLNNSEKSNDLIIYSFFSSFKCFSIEFYM